jgi:hypothetical protein
MHYSLLTRFAIVFVALASTPWQILAQDQPSSSQLARKLVRHFDDRPPVIFETETQGDHPGRILVTNTHQYPLTAVAIEVASAPESTLPPQINFADALSRSQLLSPVPRGLTFVTYTRHFVGGPIPKATLVAAIWEDGSTFGSNELLNQILEGRRATLSAFDQVLSILQSGLDEGWTRARFLSALDVARPLSLAPATMEQARIQIAGTAPYLGAKSTISAAADRDKLVVGVKALQKELQQERNRLASSAPAL